jgi:hypothetical protein
LTQIESPIISFPAAWESALKAFCDWIETIVSKEIENLVDGLTREQLLDLRIATLQKLDAAIQARLGGGADPTPSESPKIEQPRQLTYAQAPLAVAIPQYLATCSEPQTAKQIAAALLEAGRDFETTRPVLAVRTALSKMIGVNQDLFHTAWAKWWLKSKCSTKSQLEKYLSKNIKFGTGGHSKKEHGKRTAIGIQKRREQGLRWGPPVKATPELLERARQMLRDGATLTETSKTLDITTATLYQFGIKQRALKKEGELLRHQQEGAGADQRPSESGADVIPLHNRTGSDTG